MPMHCTEHQDLVGEKDERGKALSANVERSVGVATRPQMVCAAVHQCHPWISNADTHSTNGGFITE